MSVWFFFQVESLQIQLSLETLGITKEFSELVNKVLSSESLFLSSFVEKILTKNFVEFDPKLIFSKISYVPNDVSIENVEQHLNQVHEKMYFSGRKIQGKIGKKILRRFWEWAHTTRKAYLKNLDEYAHDVAQFNVLDTLGTGYVPKEVCKEALELQGIPVIELPEDGNFLWKFLS